MLICAVYDKKAMVFFPPFTVENKVVAIRSLEGTVNTSGNVLNRYPDDFALYTLGEFDDKTGNIKTYEIKTLECECRQLVMPTRSPESVFIPETEEGTRPAAQERRFERSEN